MNKAIHIATYHNTVTLKPADVKSSTYIGFNISNMKGNK